MKQKIWLHFRHRTGLVAQLVKRDVDIRFKGSFLGILWPLLTPLLTLALYTIVFGSFMRARWPGANGVAGFALVLFPGLILFTFFSECVVRAPTLITTNPNFVKKVVFPLELLVLVPIGAALFNLILGLAAWMAIAAVVNGSLPWSILLLPIVVFPIILVILGISWCLSALGVYLRDVSQITPVVTQALMFMSPILYPLDNVPKRFLWIIMLNPLTFIVEQVRAVMISGLLPNFAGLGIYTVVGIFICWVGLRFFRALRPGFADVV